jgi:Domain of unknown function (DUF4160)
MPRVGQVGGIGIYVYSNDHPPPHFHAIAALRERDAIIVIDTLADYQPSTLTAAERAAVIAWARAPGRQALLLDKFVELNPPRPPRP